MNRWLSAHGGRSSAAQEDTQVYDEFTGKIYVVDLAEIDGKTENFEGKQWLEWRVQENLPVGWDLEWVPDRNKDADNPIALMQFADDTTALLLRTHRTKQWLPWLVRHALESDSFKKIGVGYDGNDRQKMQGTFDFLPNGILDLSIIARDDKGLSATGLKALSEHFGLKMKKESRVARSNWGAPKLTYDQVRYAAEDAYFTYVLWQKLSHLPDAPKQQDPDDGSAKVGSGVLELKPGWAEAGIERRHDGLWCKLCERGPMTVPMVVERHMEGKQHKAKTERKQGMVEIANGKAVLELPDEYVQQGIVAGDGLNGIKEGEFKCLLCKAGPFSTKQVIDAHIGSKKHQKAIAPPEAKADKDDKKADGEPTDPFAEHMWNMPDYVGIEENKLGEKVLFCTLCSSKANTTKAMVNHLNGNAHAKKCRQSGHDEILFVKERDRMESLTTGQAVVRTGFIKPKRKKPAADGTSNGTNGASETNGTRDTSNVATSNGATSNGATSNGPTNNGATSSGATSSGATSSGAATAAAASKASSETSTSAAGAGAGTAPTPTKKPPLVPGLPPGWEAYRDGKSGEFYYHHAESGTCQWERPSAPGASSSSTAVPVVDEVATPARAAYVYGGPGVNVSATTSYVASGYNKPPQSACLATTVATAPTTAQSPCLATTTETGRLPPGWREVHTGGKVYYADVETQASQWTRPADYVERHWWRCVDPQGFAYWECRELNLGFYEQDTSWKRLADDRGVIYWSNASRSIRFFEPPQ